MLLFPCLSLLLRIPFIKDGRSDEVTNNKNRRALFFAVPLPPGMMISGKMEKWDLYAKIKTFDSRYKIAFNVAL